MVEAISAHILANFTTKSYKISRTDCQTTVKPRLELARRSHTSPLDQSQRLSDYREAKISLRDCQTTVKPRLELARRSHTSPLDQSQRLSDYSEAKARAGQTEFYFTARSVSETVRLQKPRLELARRSPTPPLDQSQRLLRDCQTTGKKARAGQTESHFTARSVSETVRLQKPRLELARRSHTSPLDQSQRLSDYSEAKARAGQTESHFTARSVSETISLRDCQTTGKPRLELARRSHTSPLDQSQRLSDYSEAKTRAGQTEFYSTARSVSETISLRDCQTTGKPRLELARRSHTSPLDQSQRLSDYREAKVRAGQTESHFTARSVSETVRLKKPRLELARRSPTPPLDQSQRLSGYSEA
ncbi:hypothetical protein RRG08_008138 [Elysia crispata]|uniref:Uncharacterized protein n=1 Tax=Elysia crispata TaxID=231223 RepID=A0AAE0Z609_9GAST|nr:hypothetical protein RRG08_008138 [Elysia crispata]